MGMTGRGKTIWSTGMLINKEENRDVFLIIPYYIISMTAMVNENGDFVAATIGPGIGFPGASVTKSNTSVSPLNDLLEPHALTCPN